MASESLLADNSLACAGSSRKRKERSGANGASEQLQTYPWSGHRFCSIAPKWLSTDWLNSFGGSQSQARREHRRFVDRAFDETIENPWDKLQDGFTQVLKRLEMQRENPPLFSARVAELKGEFEAASSCVKS